MLCTPYVELQRSPAKLRNGSYRVTPARKKICGAPHGTAPALPPFNRRPTGMQTNPVLKTLIRLPEYLLIGLVRGYQLMIGPHLPKTCRYTPSCSEYAIEALRKYGAVKGSILTLYRLSRCHPFGGHGYDPPRWFGEPEEAIGGQQSAISDRQSVVRSTAETPASESR